ncbi:MAG: PocR ligand-binding domain-containing protein [Desulfobacterales bacterium]|jgi:PAS domain S-box-containing protein|nr:PocR ligand-binding domain-containing protein [Desulfobacterales bacterium]
MPISENRPVDLELSEIIDTPALQRLMDYFYMLSRIPMSLIDIKGRVLVGVGWQDICTKFHRVHPDTCRNCIESDTYLSAGLAQGEGHLYKCKNNLWDMATPIIVDGEHIGNVFSGQFFFENETVDYEIFRAQAQKYGFDEKEYLAALNRVPRISREKITIGMEFLINLAYMLSRLGYNNEALRKGEQRLRRAQEIAHLGSWELDPIKNELTWSDEVYRIFGLESQQFKATYEAFLSYVHPDDRAAVNAAYLNSIRDGKDLYEIEHRITRKQTGEIRYVQEKCQHVRDHNGQIIRSLGMVLDITERKQAEEALRQLNVTLEQRVAERTELAETRAKQLQALAVELIEAEEQERRRIALILHDDIQQILAAAKLQLQWTYESLPPKSLLEKVEQMIAESIQKSRRLSHELSPPVLYHSDLSAALKWLARHMHQEFGLEVLLQTDSETQVEYEPLKKFLFRSVQEMLFNVVKHSGVKSACIRLSVTDKEIGITVSDEGRGFDTAILQSTTVKFGLGLVSLRERTHAFGGSFTIESAPGQGSRFSISIPFDFAKTYESIETTKYKHIKHLTSHMPIVNAPITRVLVVDDHQVMRKGLIKLISGQPEIQVTGEAANGREAIERVRQLKPDVIMMDVLMPVMDGIEATRRIKIEMPEMRVIGLSMYEDEHVEKMMRAAGAEAFVSKTASLSDLFKVIYGIARD